MFDSLKKLVVGKKHWMLPKCVFFAFQHDKPKHFCLPNSLDSRKNTRLPNQHSKPSEATWTSGSSTGAHGANINRNPGIPFAGLMVLSLSNDWVTDLQNMPSCGNPSKFCRKNQRNNLDSSSQLPTQPGWRCCFVLQHQHGDGTVVPARTLQLCS